MGDSRRQLLLEMQVVLESGQLKGDGPQYPPARHSRVFALECQAETGRSFFPLWWLDYWFE
jgi:hypothetical protein